MGLFWGLLSSLCFGTADFMAARSSKRIGAHPTLFYMQAVGFVLLTVVMFVLDEWRSIDTWSHAAAAGLWMLVDLAGILLLYQGLKVGHASVVAPIASSFSAVTAALAFAFGERVSPLALSGIVLTIVGVIGATVTGPGSGGARSSRVKVAQGAVWAIGAALLLGTAFFGLRYPAQAIGGVATVWIGRCQAVVLLPLLSLLAGRRLAQPGKNDWTGLAAVGALDALAIVCYNFGLLHAQTSIVITATSLFAVVTLLWGVLLAKERPSRHQWAGILLTFAGIAIVSCG